MVSVINLRVYAQLIGSFCISIISNVVTWQLVTGLVHVHLKSMSSSLRCSHNIECLVVGLVPV
jgi:hypothetical protein